MTNRYATHCDRQHDALNQPLIREVVHFNVVSVQSLAILLDKYVKSTAENCPSRDWEVGFREADRDGIPVVFDNSLGDVTISNRKHSYACVRVGANQKDLFDSREYAYELQKWSY